MKSVLLASLMMIGAQPVLAQDADSPASETVGEEATAEAELSDEDFALALGRMMAGEPAIEGQELAAAIAEAGQYPLGSEENPVRTTMPEGEFAYLRALRCSDGRPPAFERLGSGGPSPYGNIADFYAVECPDMEKTIVMDMYHGGYIEREPVPGFTIEPDW